MGAVSADRGRAPADRGPWSPDRLVRAHAAEAGGALAFVDASGSLTWAELDARCEVAADAVRAAVGSASNGPSGAIVGVIAEPSMDTIAVMLGVLRAGAILAPIPAGLATVELRAALDVLGPVLVMAPERDGDMVARAGYRVLAIDALAAPPAASDVPTFDPAPAATGTEPAFEPDAPAVIVLTSGTTGRPRGVILSGRAMAASADAWLAGLPPATGWLLALGLSHVAGLGILWRAIVGHVPVRLVAAAEPAAQLAAMTAEPAPSHVSLVPAQLARLLDAADDAGLTRPPASLRAVLLGGGPIPPALVTRAVRAGWPVVPTYGLSETGSGATALATEEALDHANSAGRPLPGVRVMIDDPGPDGVGEILVETASRFSRYLGEAPDTLGAGADGGATADSTARATAAAPVRTGDLGRLDADGRLFVVDRRVDRIVRGGENIAPAEVEAVLLAHSAVADAAVVGRPDDRWGHVPVAAVVLGARAPDPGDRALASHCRASLAGFKVPVAFMRLDVLPRTASGKLRRDTVRPLLSGECEGVLVRPGGDAIGWRVTGTGRLPIILLPGTLSTAAQLDRLAATLAAPGDVTVHALDRRGIGTGRLVPPRPLDVSVHVADLVAYLDARGIDRAAFVGVSFGGGLALEVAARHPARVGAVVAYEPPYGPVAGAATRRAFLDLAAAVEHAHQTGGAPAAAETFLRAVAGDDAWDRLPARARMFLESQGDGALADAGLTGLDPDGLTAIAAPVTILTGGASEPFYSPIADALARRIPGATRGTLDGLAHPSPITTPSPVAAAVRAALASAGLVVAAAPATLVHPTDPVTPAPEPSR